MPIKPYDEDPRSDAEKAADERVLEIEDPGPNRTHEVLGLVGMVLLAIIGGLAIDKLSPQNHWSAVGAATVVVTVLIGFAMIILRVVTRRHR